MWLLLAKESPSNTELELVEKGLSILVDIFSTRAYYDYLIVNTTGGSVVVQGPPCQAIWKSAYKSGQAGRETAGRSKKIAGQPAHSSETN